MLARARAAVFRQDAPGAHPSDESDAHPIDAHGSHLSDAPGAHPSDERDAHLSENGSACAVRPALLHAENVSLTYPGPIPVHALSDVNLAVAHGERIALIGPSGAGKSSLLNILGLLDTPTAGEYRIAGRRTAAASEKERAHLRSTWFGFIFQAFHLLDRRSVLDNVRLGMFFSPIPTDEWDDRAADALETVGLAHRIRTQARLLSGGERQRAAIARAVVHSPRVLMADEPTGNLDSRNSERILELLASLHQPDGAQIIVTHDEDVAAQMDRAVTVFDGTVSNAATD
nr:hypothetical protein GCM10023233_07210 [Brevibacterium otitidis]